MLTGFPGNAFRPPSTVNDDSGDDEASTVQGHDDTDDEEVASLVQEADRLLDEMKLHLHQAVDLDHEYKKTISLISDMREMRAHERRRNPLRHLQA